MRLSCLCAPLLALLTFFILGTSALLAQPVVRVRSRTAVELWWLATPGEPTTHEQHNPNRLALKNNKPNRYPEEEICDAM